MYDGCIDQQTDGKIFGNLNEYFANGVIAVAAFEKIIASLTFNGHLPFIYHCNLDFLNHSSKAMFKPGIIWARNEIEWMVALLQEIICFPV